MLRGKKSKERELIRRSKSHEAAEGWNLGQEPEESVSDRRKNTSSTAQEQELRIQLHLSVGLVAGSPTKTFP